MSEDRIDKPEDERHNNDMSSENDLSERKITRNQKRKHDEINHVQKVSKNFFILYFLPLELASSSMHVVQNISLTIQMYTKYYTYTKTCYLRTKGYRLAQKN